MFKFEAIILLLFLSHPNPHGYLKYKLVAEEADVLAFPLVQFVVAPFPLELTVSFFNLLPLHERVYSSNALLGFASNPTQLLLDD